MPMLDLHVWRRRENGVEKVLPQLLDHKPLGHDGVLGPPQARQDDCPDTGGAEEAQEHLHEGPR